ncbi:MAG TPA: formate--tetrahydrofolate ligase [Armatimonadota bacterium]|nr:formate--tetrahydrofolate ligase [Armatimonadota bacterium]
MLTDVEIAQQATPKPIREIAEQLGIHEDELEYYGRDKAKISLEALTARSSAPDGKLILMTAITPTPAGEGKTTTTIGLGDALRKLGKSSCIALREPSLGPCFGIKGGAAGGGYAQVIPMTDINLHFTGDFHAVTTAHNLLAALLDNHLYQGNDLQLDIHAIAWKRVLDMNDRALRNIVIGLGGKTNGIPRESGFDITTSSEVMALLALASGRKDLENRLERIIAGYTKDGTPVTAHDLQASSAMAVVLKDAIKPNLVQTLEGTPALIHAGPFGNIAHGCNSILATKMALKTAEYTVTEAGFGSDLGAEKFFDIVCRVADFHPVTAVVVATIRALKMHGGTPLADLAKNDPAAVERGITNLIKHCENIRHVGLEPIVAINRFPTDTEDELATLAKQCEQIGVQYALSEVWAHGGDGGIELAKLVVDACEQPSHFHPAYADDLSLHEKINLIARDFYGADGVELSPLAERQLDEITALGFGHLPVCIAKTQNSLSDNPKLLGRPQGFTISVREAKVNAGAGFVVIYAGNIMTMPGLPKNPAATKIGIKPDGTIYGLF